MTKSEWDACTDAEEMLRFLRSKGSDRKLRLYGAACCRLVWDEIARPESRRLLDTLEGRADEDLGEVGIALGFYDNASGVPAPVPGIVECLAVPNAWQAASNAAFRAARSHRFGLDSGPGEQAVCDVLRDVFNPYRPAGDNPAFGKGMMPELAAVAYDQRILPAGTLDGARLAVLADALVRAGCDDVELLGHLRGPGPHYRGCWAVDAIMGKS
jgi:hypothetical protein